MACFTLLELYIDKWMCLQVIDTFIYSWNGVEYLKCLKYDIRFKKSNFWHEFWNTWNMWFSNVLSLYGKEICYAYDIDLYSDMFASDVSMYTWFPWLGSFDIWIYWDWKSVLYWEFYTELYGICAYEIFCGGILLETLSANSRWC